MDIQTELRGRTDALYALLERRGLDGALFVGNSAVGTPAYDASGTLRTIGSTIISRPW